MRRMIARFSMLGVSLLTAAPVFAAEPEVLVSENFSAAPASPWKWIRENRAGWRTGAKGLEVNVEPGNMWGPSNDAKNVLVRPAPEAGAGELEITVTFTNEPASQYEQADLVWYYDDSHMVKIGQEMVDGKLSIVMGREEKDRTRTIAILPLKTATVTVRFLVKGDTIRGQFMPEGSKEWQDAGNCTLPAPAEGKPHLSLQFYQGAKEAPHWARASAFTIRKRP